METSKPVKGLIVSRDEDSLDEQKVRNHTYRRREDLEKFERIRLSALLDQHAKSTKKLDKESRALDCLVLLMNSKNFKHLKALLKNDATPDDFKILICDYFIRERCMEINGLIGENLMVILSDYIKSLSNKSASNLKMANKGEKPVSNLLNENKFEDSEEEAYQMMLSGEY